MTTRLLASALGLLALFSAPKAFAAYQQRLVMPGSETPSMSSVRSSSVSPDSSSSSSASSAVYHLDVQPTVTVAVEDNAHMTRAQFTALIVQKLYSQQSIDRCYWDIASFVPPRFTLVFTDVHVGDTYAKEICVAMRDGLIQGYGDGSFRPERTINAAESMKILSKAFVLAPYADADRLSPWYEQHVIAMAKRHAIPLSVTRLDQLLTAAEVNEMFARLQSGTTSLPSRTYEDLRPKVVRKQAAVTVPKKETKKQSSSASSQSSSSATSQTSKKSLWDLF